MGGKYEPGNIITVEITNCNTTTANHVMWHFANWQLHGKWEDELAYKCLAGSYSKEEIIAQKQSAGGKIGGKKSGIRTFELKVGCHAPGMASKGGQKLAELGVGIHAPGMASKGGKIGGKKTGDKKGGATTSAQKWQCLITDHISTPGPLARYQRARGIDTSLRIRRLDLEG